MKPRLLDLYCCAGGAAYGYMKAGFEVTGVDINPQKRYIGDAFVQADALTYALSHGWQFDAIHASPPCQAHSRITPDTSQHIDLIPHTRFVLQSLGLPFVIENVEGARAALRNPVMLCGADFGLKVYRHRLFESSITLCVPDHVPHGDRGTKRGSGLSKNGFIVVTGNGGFGLPNGFNYAKNAMGINWMHRDELSDAIPPAFTAYLGRQLIAHINGEGLPIQQRMFA